MSTETSVPTASDMGIAAASAGGGDSTATALGTSSPMEYFNAEVNGALSSKASAAEAPVEGATSKPTTSSTAYAFAGSDLGSESTANINETSTKKESNTESQPSGEKEEEKIEESMYECNICLDTAKDSVVSMCGHLFCWPCLHQWLETRPNRKLCPVCKAAIDKDKVIPLYGRNSAKQEDPRNKVPPRPAGHRIEPDAQTGFQGFGFGDGFHMSFGIGAFPFGYFASSFNFGEGRPAAANRGTMQYDDEQALSKLFLYLAFLCIVWLLFA